MDKNELRQKAQEIVRLRDKPPSELTSEEMIEMVHELQVHQVELELQNEELQKTQVELAAARDAYARLYDEAPVGYLTIDERGRIVQSNVTFVAMTGRALNSILLKSFSDFIEEEYRSIYLARFKAFFKKPENKTMELRLLRGKKPPLWVSLAGRSVDGSVSQALRGSGPVCLFIVSDISSRIEAEEARKKIDAQMQRAQKLESLGVLAGGIAHDFNNLLHAIVGNADLVLEDLPEDSPSRQCVEDILTTGERAAQLCRQMLTYAGKAELNNKLLNLNEVVDSTTAVVRAAISKRTTLDFRLTEELPLIKGDSAKLSQVVLNLVTNASDALEGKDGVVTISTERRLIDRDFLAENSLLDVLQEGEFVCLIISDTGCGMDEEMRNRLFDPFFTTKFLGRGLGLAAVLGIVHSHNGFIHVDSELGHGATFTVGFPICEEEVGVEVQPLISSWRGSGTVLVVEDEEPARVVIRRMLGRMGFQVAEASNGQEGLSLIRERRRQKLEPLRLVVLDKSMPVLDGREAYAELREIAPHLPVLISSGYEKKVTMVDFPSDRNLAFLKKPYTSFELSTVIRSLLNE
mgnify:FL=1